MKIRAKLIFKVLLPVIVAFAGGRLASAALPPAPDGVTIQEDVVYLKPPRAVKLDLYLPSNRPAGTRSPGIVIIHGGGWSAGSKSTTIQFEEGVTLANAGYVCASVDYVILPQYRWQLNVIDCKNAVRFLRANAPKYGVDPQRIGVIGQSAGGHLALMTALTDDVPDLEPGGENDIYPGVSDKVSAVVDLYGITDLHTTKNMDARGNPTTTDPNKWNAVFGNHRPITEADRDLMSPVTHIKPNSPPVLIFHGDHDVIVDRDQSYELDKKLSAAGVPHKLIIVPGVGHTFDLEHQSDGSPMPMDLRPDVLAFFDKYVKASQ